MPVASKAVVALTVLGLTAFAPVLAAAAAVQAPVKNYAYVAPAAPPLPKITTQTLHFTARQTPPPVTPAPAAVVPPAYKTVCLDRKCKKTEQVIDDLALPPQQSSPNQASWAGRAHGG